MKIDSVILVLLALAAMLTWGRERERTGELREANRILAAQQAKAETVYVQRTDTLKLTRRITDSILTVDTLWRTDTVRALVLAERNACNAVVSACEDRVRLLKERYANLEKQQPNWLQRQLGHLPYLGAGIVAGAVLVK